MAYIFVSNLDLMKTQRYRTYIYILIWMRFFSFLIVYLFLFNCHIFNKKKLQAKMNYINTNNGIAAVQGVS